MAKTEVSFTSLCFIEEDYDGNVWLRRVADIENGRLQTPFKSNRLDNYFENRDRLYRNDGLSAIGSIGVWDWTAIPNRNNPDSDYVQTYYVQDVYPIRVVVTNAGSIEDLAEQLKNGSIKSPCYICDTLFCYLAQGRSLTGLLCRSKEFKISNNTVKIQEDICSLPYYTIYIDDVFNWDDKHLRFLQNLDIGEPAGYFSIGDTWEAIRNIILERATWPLFKECIGATKAEWRHSKTLLERITGKSLYDAVSEKLKCTVEYAKQVVDDFISHASRVISSGDIDVDVLAQIAMHHDGLRLQCEETIAKKWQENHAADIAQAEAELITKKAAVEVEVDAVRQQLHDVMKQVETAEACKEKLIIEIGDAQARLTQLLTEIEHYEILGNETLVAVREKIATAQRDMAGFIADMSVFLPPVQPQNTTTPETQVVRWRYERAPIDGYSNDEIDFSESWDDEFNAISQNLTQSLAIKGEIGNMLAAFCYATHHNQIPLLIAGPAGLDIADATATALYASKAGHLWIGNEPTTDIVVSFSDCDESIITVENMFGKGWHDGLPQSFAKLRKHIIWTHPYVEDLIIEPKGLFNYMLPVLSECFIGTIPSLELFPSKRADKFSPFISKQKQPLKISSFKRLKISKLLTNQLTLALSDAKAILNQPSKDKDMEILFGLLPLCVITGRTDILKETIETESGISSAIKAEVMRYIEEE